MQLPDVLLIVSDNAFCESTYRELSEQFCITRVSGSGELEAAVAAKQFDCVLMTGIDPIPANRVLEITSDYGLPVVFRDHNMTVSLAVGLTRAGAFHCFDHRDSLEQLREALDSAVEERRSLARARNTARGTERWRSFLIGESPAMAQVAETVKLAGPRRCTVLIGGETGTGKEMAARALHLASPRANANMVAINCSAVPENLLEAELFGHAKGAFTGAIGARVGRFEQAHKSTLFLDEIGDMPLGLQAKLLRFLQDREVQPLGSPENIKIDVRVIAASNVDLLERVRQGRFREDLYYRLNVFPLEMPPLRKRASDIPMLVSHFITKICHAEDIPLKRVAPEALAQLSANPWPGNVRQLENAVEMAIAVSGDRDLLYTRDFGLAESRRASGPVNAFVPIPAQLSEAIDFDTAVSRFELAMLENALRASDGNKTVAAERLGIKRTTLIMKMRNLENSRLFLQKAG